uniref:Electron transfer flavoprotein beta subunit lysine methyltransferase n=1 Tax=Neolamprologus brichardi TaxID=32507 RepID=A0A3Q4H819_NEOBR
KLTTTQGHRYLSNVYPSAEHIRKFIIENTEITGEQSLTPEIRLRLFTPRCRFWRERPELWPFDDPYWAIYWPGGQALSRYILDNPEVCRNQTVLDLGSGCGASAIAATLRGAAHVVANDVDTVAAVATQMNCELNGLEPPVCLTTNMIGSEPDAFSLILLGDINSIAITSDSTLWSRDQEMCQLLKQKGVLWSSRRFVFLFYFYVMNYQFKKHLILLACLYLSFHKHSRAP